MKTTELSGALLDYWASRANESWKWAHELFPTMTLDATFKDAIHDDSRTDLYGTPAPACFLVPNNPFRQDYKLFAPSTNWEHGGPIVERERISIATIQRNIDGDQWTASLLDDCSDVIHGDTPLVAAMRCLVASKFGADVPDEVPA